MGAFHPTDSDASRPESWTASSDGSDAQFLPPSPAIRCLNCFYVLNHLPEPRCPECGTLFDPNNPSTFTTKPPFIWWRYWLPGFLLSVGLGGASYAILIPLTGFGWSVTLVIPMMIGGIVGYAGRGSQPLLTMIAFVAFASTLVSIAAFGAAGVICGAILTAMAVVPLAVSVALGRYLRSRLKASRWSLRDWLPILLLFLLPLGVAAVELVMPPSPEVVVETTADLDTSLPAAWEGVMFYEQVRHEPPWLLRVTLRRPLYTTGSVAGVGDRKTCVYTRGHLTKEVTAREPLKLLEFAVVEQTMFEDYSVRLTGGGFYFEPIDANHTRVTLRTRYKPLLHPRWSWQPPEEYVVHLLHRHVLKGMRENAQNRGRQKLEIAGPR